MSIIIRLQNLPLSANSLDIRKYFAGLSIPDGGVHIVGGEKGDAFIAFSSDDDARQAMAKDGGKIKDAPIKLFLSSRSEMQQVIAQARSGITVPTNATYKPVQPVSTPQPHASNFTPQTSFASNAVRSGYNDGLNRPRDRSRSPLRVGPSNGNHVQTTIQVQPMIRPTVQTPMAGLAPVIPRESLDVRARLGGYLDEMSNGRQGGQLQPDGGSGGQWSRRPPDITSSGGVFDDRVLSQSAASVFDQRSMSGNGVDLGAGCSRDPPKPFNGRVEMRGLPFNVTTRDIQDFFRLGCGLLIPDDSVRILVDERGFTTGGATVRMANEQDLISAVGLSGRLIGNQAINITPMPLDLNPDLGRLNEQLAMNQAPFVPVNVPVPTAIVAPAPVANPQRDLVIYMKGIPFNACTEKDVSNFFIGLKIEQVVFEMDRRTGKPAGNAYVEFKSKEDYERALEMNLKHMGRRYIEVFPTTRDDMEEARSVATGLGGTKETFCVNISGLPPSVTNADLTSYFKEVNAVPFAIHIMLKSNGTNAGEAFIEFADGENQARALSRHGDVINGYRITIKETAFAYMQRIVGRPANPPGPVFVDHRTRGFDSRGRGGFRGRGGRGRGGGRFSDREGLRDDDRSSPNTRKDCIGDSRCVVHASNVPYKATNDDLATFFADFAVVPGSIERKLNERGLATPEARIVFKNPFEAERAAKIMHKKHLLGRPVFLRIA